jgi:hypothetical protein
MTNHQCPSSFATRSRGACVKCSALHFDSRSTDAQRAAHPSRRSREEEVVHARRRWLRPSSTSLSNERPSRHDLRERSPSGARPNFESEGGSAASARNAARNKVIPTGGWVDFGYEATFVTSPPVPPKNFL